jgi:hypothetical protein
MRASDGNYLCGLGILFIYGSTRLSVMRLEQIFGCFDRFIDRGYVIRCARSMSLAWLCINGLRLQEGLFAIYPSADRNERFLIALEGAGPDCWDAEDLRGFFGYYEHDQKPEGY